MKAFLLFFVLVFSSHIVYGRQFPIQHYTMKDGLVHATVFRIYQDKKGFLWFCTDYGLSMFNGKTFRNYTVEDGLTDKTVISVSEDQYANKLVSTYRGGVVIISDTSVAPLSVLNGKIPAQMGYTLTVGNRLWLISFVAGGRLGTIYNNRFSEIPVKYKGDDVSVYRINLLDNEIFLTSDSGIYKIINDTVATPYLAGIFGGIPVQSVQKNASGGYWVGIKDQIVYVLHDKVQKIFPCEDLISDMLIDRQHNVWAATDGGKVWLVRNDSISDITASLTLPQTAVTDLFEDNEGNIWLATQGLGVYRVGSLDILMYPAEKNLINNYCNAITPINKDEIWTGSFGIISKWDNGKLTAIESSLTPSEFVYFIKPYRGAVYMGTPSGLVRKEIHPPYGERILNKKKLGAISCCDDKTGGVLIGSYNNLYKLKNDQLELFDSTGFLKNRRCNAIAYDENGVLWIGTDSAAIKYEKGVYSYVAVPYYRHPFKIKRMLLDGRNRMWFSTPHGLICKDRNSYRIFTTQDGLNSNDCMELFEDEHHILWVSTRRGINTIDLASLAIKEFVLDMDASEITSLLKYKDHLFVGTIEGLSVINIKVQQSRNEWLPTYITQVKTLRSKYNMPREVSLPYNDNKVEIEFAALNYRHPERVEYRYKIENLDTTWHATRNSSIELSALSGGSYRFVLNSRLDNGKWGRDVVLPITVAIPFWQAWWFITLVVIIMVLTLFLGIKKWAVMVEGRKRNKLMILNQVTYLKQQALSALINPHFIFNCMNSIQHYLNRKDHEQAGIYLSEFSDLIRMTIESAQEAFIDLEKELKRIRHYLALEQLRVGAKLSYEITIDPAIDTRKTRIPNMILQPYIENAIWHGIIPKKGDGKISVCFEITGNANLKIRILDDGVGFGKGKAPVKEHLSVGIKLTETRLHLLNKLLNEYYQVKVIHLDEHGTTGTIIEIILPCMPDEEQVKLLEKEIGMPWQKNNAR